MTDPDQPEQSDSSRGGSEPAAPLSDRYPPYTDPAYAGQTPTYGLGYVPPYAPPSDSAYRPSYGAPYATNPTEQSTKQSWLRGEPPTGEPPDAESSPPGPPRSPRWLWILAVAAVLLVVGLVFILVMDSDSATKPIVAPPLTPIPSSAAPSRIPTTSSSPAPTTETPPSTSTSPSETTSSSPAGIVVYSVSGQGRALSVAYVDAGGVLETEFNVSLPWSKQVSITSTNARPSVTVVNVGEQITCTLTVNGTQVRQHTGSFFTICAG